MLKLELIRKALNISELKKANCRYNRSDDEDFSVGVSEIEKGEDLTIIASGAIVHEALKAAKIIKNDLSLNVGVIDLYRIKPLPEVQLLKLLKDKKDSNIRGGVFRCGMGSMIASFLLKNLISNLLRLGIRDHFCFDYGTRDSFRCIILTVIK